MESVTPNSVYEGNTVNGGSVQYGHRYTIASDYETKEKENLRTECLRALYWTDPEVDLAKAKDRTVSERTPGTCQWILDNEDFIAWDEAPAPRLLLLTGEPGIGKTIVATFLVDKYKKETCNGERTFAYFFCVNGEARQSTGISILRGLLLLLLRSHPFLYEHLAEDFKVKGEQLFGSVQSLWAPFAAVIMDQRLGPLLLLLDGLDECEESSRDLLVSRFGTLIRQDRCRNLKLIVHSRVNRTANDLEMCFRPGTHRIIMDTAKVNPDIQRFIKHEVPVVARARAWTSDLTAQVEEYIRSREGGTFIWISLALRMVARCHSYRVLPTLQQLPPDLKTLYARILDEISLEDREYARKILVLVTGAREPLTLDELSIALCFYESGELSRKSLPTDSEITSTRSWIESCSLLLRCVEDHDRVKRHCLVQNSGSSFVTLIHLSVKDFLIDRNCPDPYRVDQNEAIDTLFGAYERYIRSAEFESIARDLEELSNPAPNRSEPTLRGQDRQFLQNFSTLHPAVPIDLDLQTTSALQERRSFQPCQAWTDMLGLQLLLLPRISCDIGFVAEWSKGIKILDMLAECDFGKLFALIIEDDLDCVFRVLHASFILPIDLPDWDRPSALPKLLARAAKLERRQILRSFSRPTRSVTEPQGREMLVRAMRELERSAEENDVAFNILFQTARSQQDSGDSLLHAAIRFGRLRLVKLCIKEGYSICAQNTDGKTVLHLISEHRNEFENGSEASTCIRLLLDADPEKQTLMMQDSNGDTPLHRSVIYECLEYTEALLEADKEKKSIAIADKFGILPLHAAAEDGNEGVVHMLIQADKEKKTIAIADNYGRLPLHLAIEYDSERVVQMLIEADKEKKTIAIADNDGRLPLHRAAEKGHVAMLQTLIEADKEKKTIAIADNYGRMPLHLTAEECDSFWSHDVVLECVQTLVEADATKYTLFAEDRNEQTPVDLAKNRLSFLLSLSEGLSLSDQFMLESLPPVIHYLEQCMSEAAEVKHHASETEVSGNESAS